MQCMTDYSSRLSQHFLSPWPDVCEVWGLRSDTWADGAASLVPWVCAPPKPQGVSLDLQQSPPPAVSTLGAPLPTSRALWGVPLPQGSVPTTLTFLGSLDSHSALSPWLWGSLGSSWAPTCSSILQTLSGQMPGCSGPRSCSPLRPDAPRVSNAQVLRAVCWCFCSCCFRWEGESSLCCPVFAGSESPFS